MSQVGVQTKKNLLAPPAELFSTPHSQKVLPTITYYSPIKFWPLQIGEVWLYVSGLTTSKPDFTTI